MKIALGVLPDDLVNWSGSAAQLAEKANGLLAQLDPAIAKSEINERLVRYYAQEGVLAPPDREGREAIFRFRQLIELLVARFLIRDKWPLKKVGELIRSSDLTALQNLAPGVRIPTPAEEAVARLRAGDLDPLPSMSFESPRFRLESSAQLVSDSAASYQRLSHRPPSSALNVATDISQRRSSMKDNLKTLGNPAGEPERRRTLRVTLTPWCHVYLNMDEVRSMDEHTPEILGAALTQALHEERIKKGEKT